MSSDGTAESIFRIAAGDITATISAVGGAIRRLEYRGRPLLRPCDAEAVLRDYVNVVLAPWPNRVCDGRFSFAGAEHQLAITEPERGHALHGFTPREIFTPTRRSDTDAVELAATVGPEPGWPWPITVTAHYKASADGLTVTLDAHNRSAEPAPVALGLHTYLDAQGADLDECTLATGLGSRLPLDTQLIPAGPAQPLDHSTWAMRTRTFDDAFAFAPREPAPTRLIGPEGRGVQLSVSPRMGWQQIYTSPERWLAVEPMTAPPNALADATDLIVLAPGEHVDAWVRIQPVGRDLA